jgi:hypothetical protein
MQKVRRVSERKGRKTIYYWFSSVKLARS